jgi:hypothetical protein
MLGTARLILLVGGTLLLFGGIVLVGAGEGGAFVGGAWLIVIGAVLVGTAVLERLRYRSDVTDRANPPVGPGGGEPAGSLEPRFVPTGEVFRDPPSGRRMRVFVDPRTGERRYVAEG